MNLSKINSDLGMLIILILKNTVFEILEGAVANLLEKQLVELRQVLLLE
jgi:hypothetical protein